MKTVKKLTIFVIILSIFASLFVVSASARPNEPAFGGATVDTAAGLNLRSGPATSYSIVTVIPHNAVMVVYSRINSQWLHVNFHGDVGYVKCEFLRDILPARNFTALGRVEGFLVNIRSRPYTASNILIVVGENTEVDVIGINNGWYKVRHGGHTGYIRSDLMRVVGPPRPGVLPNSPANNAAAAANTTPAAPAAPAQEIVRVIPPADLELGEQVVYFAKSLLGTRYVWGGTSRSGFDCSGFVVYVLSNFDISVRRVANDQFNNNGTRIGRNDVAPGDLVFFSSNGGRTATHVGIYVGDGYFIHSSSARTGVIISSLNSQWHRDTFIGANRVIS